jgi:hypothetical protein
MYLACRLSVDALFDPRKKFHVPLSLRVQFHECFNLILRLHEPVFLGVKVQTRLCLRENSQHAPHCQRQPTN